MLFYTVKENICAAENIIYIWAEKSLMMETR